MNKGLKKFLIRLLFNPAVMTLLVIWGGLYYLKGGSFKSKQFIPKELVWAKISNLAPKFDLDPTFVYSIAMAESTLNASASSGYARGIMQMSEVAWKTVTNDPYSEAWDWQENIRIAIKYLYLCKSELEDANQFSYPKLAASYRYGINKLRRLNYRLDKLPKNKNNIYKLLFEDKRAITPALITD